MSKSKRTVLEGADKMGRTVVVKADYKAGRLWLEQHQIAGLGRSPSGLEAVESTYGWLDASKVAKATGESQADVERRWRELTATIN